MKILVCESITIEGMSILKKNFEVDFLQGLSPTELVTIIPDYHAVIVKGRTKITHEIIKAGVKLKIIARGGIGLDNIDMDCASIQGIQVVNTPNASVVSVAEFTIGIMFALARNIVTANQMLKQGKWNKAPLLGYELCGKTLGLIGLGRIGTKVGQIASAIGMKVMFYDRHISSSLKVPFKAVTYEELLQYSDWISLHVPLTNDTRNMLNQEAFNCMKQGVFILNCARGGIIDEASLCSALNSGKVSGVALDVFAKEPIDYKHRLLNYDNVLVSPHIGAFTQEAQIRSSIELATIVVEFLKKLS